MLHGIKMHHLSSEIHSGRRAAPQRARCHARRPGRQHRRRTGAHACMAETTGELAKLALPRTELCAPQGSGGTFATSRMPDEPSPPLLFTRQVSFNGFGLGFLLEYASGPWLPESVREYVAGPWIPERVRRLSSRSASWIGLSSYEQPEQAYVGSTQDNVLDPGVFNKGDQVSAQASVTGMTVPALASSGPDQGGGPENQDESSQTAELLKPAAPSQLGLHAIALVLFTEFLSAVLNGMQGTSFQLVVTEGLGLSIDFIANYYMTMAVVSVIGHAIVPFAVKHVSPRTLVVLTLLMLLVSDFLQARACMPGATTFAAPLLLVSGMFRAGAGLRGPILFVWWSISIPSRVQPRFIGLQNGSASVGGLLGNPLLAIVSSVMPNERDVGAFCGVAGVGVHLTTSVLIAYLIEPRSVQQAMREREKSAHAHAAHTLRTHANGDTDSNAANVLNTAERAKRRRCCAPLASWVDRLIERVPLLYVVLITKGAFLYGLSGAWTVTTFAVALKRAYGLTLREFALLNTPVQLCGALAPLLFVLLNERIGFYRLAILANAVSLLGLLKINWSDLLTPQPLSLVIVAMSALQVSNALLSNLSHAILMNRAPPDQVANLSTLNFFCFTVGLLAAARIATWVYGLASEQHPMLGPVSAFLGALIPVYLTNFINICCFGRYLFRRL